MLCSICMLVVHHTAYMVYNRRIPRCILLFTLASYSTYMYVYVHTYTLYTITYCTLYVSIYTTYIIVYIWRRKLGTTRQEGRFCANGGTVFFALLRCSIRWTANAKQRTTNDKRLGDEVVDGITIRPMEPQRLFLCFKIPRENI